MPQVKAASPATHDHVFVARRADRDPPPCRAPRTSAVPGVSGAVAIVLAFGAQQESVQPLVLAHRVDAIAPAGKHLVDVALVADVEDELVLRRVEDAMQRDRQFDHAEVRAEMAAGLRKNADQLVAHFLRELRQLLLLQRLDVRRRTNALQD